MRKTAKFLSLVLAILMIVAAAVTTASAASFKDVSAKDENLTKAVELLNTIGVVKGTSETTFGTNKNVTREQMAAFIYRMMKGGVSREGGENTTPFTDLKDPTYFYMISWAHTQGIIKGTSATTFNPDGNITLQDAYVMLVRALGYETEGNEIAYPYGYIDIADTIGLSENVPATVKYTDKLTRGNAAIVLYNAFYAPMNTVTETNLTGNAIIDMQLAAATKEKSVSTTIYNLSYVHRRVVATPNYAIDLTDTGDGADFKAYEPTGTLNTGYDTVILGAVVGDETKRLENESSMYKFSDFGLEGKADDYFLRDLVIYMKNDGSIFACDASGKAAISDAMTYSVENVTEKSSTTTYANGTIAVDGVKGYMFEVPENGDQLWMICPISSDEDGRLTFKAATTWYGGKQDVTSPTSGTRKSQLDNIQNKMRVQLSTALCGTTGIGKSTCQFRYFDSDGNNSIDYLWLLPFTFGKIVDKKGEGAKTTAKHTGDNAYICYWNEGKGVPEIYVGGAKVEGGSYEDGKWVLAYVSGPANYVLVASDDVNSSIVDRGTSKLIATNSAGTPGNTLGFDTVTCYAWDSGHVCVGHCTFSKGKANGILGAAANVNSGDPVESGIRSSLSLGSSYHLITAGNRVMWFEKVEDEDSVDIANQYAIVNYINEDQKKVVQKAGGIGVQGTLELDGYVSAFMDGAYKMVKIAPYCKYSKSGIQDDNYFVDEDDGNIVNRISSYTVDEDGYYTFRQFKTGTGTAADLAGDDLTGEMVLELDGGISLEKVADNYYRFVGVDGAAVPATLKPNGMNYVVLNESTKIIVNYVDEDGESNYEIYDNGRYPKFDAKDVDMEFKNAVIVLGNKTDSTTAENLKFLYFELGSTIINATDKTDDTYRIVVSCIENVMEDGEVIYTYKVVDPYTGTVDEGLEAFKKTDAPFEARSIWTLDADGLINNSSKAYTGTLNSTSKELVTLAEYDADTKLVFIDGAEDPYQLDDKSVITIFDRKDNSVKVSDASILEIKAEDDELNEYYTDGKMVFYMITDEAEDTKSFDTIKLLMLVRGED